MFTLFCAPTLVALVKLFPPCSVTGSRLLSHDHAPCTYACGHSRRSSPIPKLTYLLPNSLICSQAQLCEPELTHLLLSSLVSHLAHLREPGLTHLFQILHICFQAHLDELPSHPITCLRPSSLVCFTRSIFPLLRSVISAVV